jgi:hypothetical protein
VGAVSQTDAFTPFSTTSNGEFKQAQKERRKSNVGWVYDVSAKTKQKGYLMSVTFLREQLADWRNSKRI